MQILVGSLIKGPLRNFDYSSCETDESLDWPGPFCKPFEAEVHEWERTLMLDLHRSILVFEFCWLCS